MWIKQFFDITKCVDFTDFLFNQSDLVTIKLCTKLRDSLRSYKERVLERPRQWRHVHKSNSWQMPTKTCHAQQLSTVNRAIGAASSRYARPWFALAVPALKTHWNANYACYRRETYPIARKGVPVNARKKRNLMVREWAMIYLTGMSSRKTGKKINVFVAVCVTRRKKRKNLIKEGRWEKNSI